MPKRAPTIKQARAIKNAVENGGNITRAMLDAGYSPATANNPSNLTTTSTWEQALEEYLPDTDLLQVGKDGLQATKLATSFTEADQMVPDWPTRHRYYETALKLKKRLGSSEQGPGNTTNILVMPSDLITKYGVSSNTKPGSER